MSTTLKAVASTAYLSASEFGAAGSTTAGVPFDNFAVGGESTNSSNGNKWSINTTGTATSINVIASKEVSLAAAVTTLDLTAVVTLLGSKAFAKVRGIMFKNLATAESGHTVAVGPNASNGFGAFLSGTTPRLVVPPQGSVLLLNPQIAAWAVDGTHKSLDLDPGANTVDFVVAIIGE